MRDEIYISTDVETDGPCPGLNSMLSLGAVAFNNKGEELSSFYANLQLLPEASPNLDTMAFWTKNQTAYNATRMSMQEPEAVMMNYYSWCNNFAEKKPIVFVAFPAGFDFTWAYWYLHRFVGDSPFFHAALDIRTYAMALYHQGYSRTSKKYLPKQMFPAHMPHSHNALLDAREQGLLFINLLNERDRSGIFDA